MSQTVAGTRAIRTLDGNDLPADVTLEVLSNQRRRFVLHYLVHNGDQTTVSELAEHVASWENEKPIRELSHRERKRVRNALRQFHLPKMAEYGFVEFDQQRGDVELTEAAANSNFYVDSITGSEVPWGVYYLGLSAVSIGCLAGLWAGVYPFVVLPPLGWGVFFITALTISSIGHFYDNYYRMRLGARDRPPEVEAP